MTKVKICGVTNLEDALVSTKLGADALGFNFYEKSPRYIDPVATREILDRLPDSILKVGVFVNESVEKIVEIADMSGLDAIQLHGDESFRFVTDLHSKTELALIKAVRVCPNFDRNAVLDYDVHAILLDSCSAGVYGGSGDGFDWNIALDLERFIGCLYLAGGLQPSNVSQAIKIVQPYAVDVASGVESSKGKKDPIKLEAFINNAKNA